MLWIDNNLCTKCSICVKMCPDGFEMKNGDFVIKDPDASCVDKAISACPVGAIKSDVKKVATGKTQYTAPANIPGPGRGLGRGGGRGLGMGMGYRRGGGRGRGRGGGGRGR